MAAGGSSPRAWGIPAATDAGGGEIRFIPTCVGNTMSDAYAAELASVHPHVRGEYARRRHSRNFPRRFIPTCVGNTADQRRCARHATVHPHVRGEYSAARLMARCKHGSSPRAWGILKQQEAQEEKARFIPTCVGNTRRNDISVTMEPVHPHVRGEYPFLGRQLSCHSGSSPRAWGILGCRAVRHDDLRFIPTCVGNTCTGRGCPSMWPVHPHVRGEYSRAALRQSAHNGSSPRAWGIHGRKKRP